MIEEPSKILELPPTTRSNILKALVTLSKYLGCYQEFTTAFKNHGVKWVKGDSFKAFLGMVNNNHSNLKDWIKKAYAALPQNDKLFKISIKEWLEEI